MFKRHGHNNLAKCIKSMKTRTEVHHKVIDDILWGFVVKSRKGRKFLRKYNFLIEG